MAQFTQQELEQLQSYLAQQGVVFNPDYYGRYQARDRLRCS